MSKALSNEFLLVSGSNSPFNWKKSSITLPKSSVIFLDSDSDFTSGLLSVRYLLLLDCNVSYNDCPCLTGDE